MGREHLCAESRKSRRWRSEHAGKAGPTSCWLDTGEARCDFTSLPPLCLASTWRSEFLGESRVSVHGTQGRSQLHTELAQGRDGRKRLKPTSPQTPLPLREELGTCPLGLPGGNESRWRLWALEGEQGGRSRGGVGCVFLRSLTVIAAPQMHE